MQDGASSSANKGSLTTSSQLQDFLSGLFAGGFTQLLDVRLTCSRTPENVDVFAVSAILVTLQTTQLDDTTNGVTFQSTTKVVTGIDHLNAATSNALATLWDRPSLLPRQAPAHVAVLDSYRTRLDLSHAANGGDVRVSVQRVPTNSDVCERVQAWNELRGELDLKDAIPHNARRADAQQAPRKCPSIT